jgi:5-methylcytosine-specific restriction protein A
MVFMDRSNIVLADREHIRQNTEHPWRAWYKSPIWKTIKRHRLIEEPNCRKCASEGKAVPASHVAHIQHHRGDWALFATYANTQSLCHKHLVQHRHSRLGGLAH